MSGAHPIVTPAIASNAATQTSDVLSGVLVGLVIDVFEADGTESSNTCTITLSDNLGRTLWTDTGITGFANYVMPQKAVVDTAGDATGSYAFQLVTNQTLTVTIASGTDTEYVRVYVLLA